MVLVAFFVVVVLGAGVVGASVGAGVVAVVEDVTSPVVGAVGSAVAGAVGSVASVVAVVVPTVGVVVGICDASGVPGVAVQPAKSTATANILQMRFIAKTSFFKEYTIFSRHCKSGRLHKLTR